MKKVFNKKIVFIFISILVSLFGLVTVGLGFYSQKVDKYSFYIKDSNAKILINDIRIGDSIVELSNYKYKSSYYDKKTKKIVFSNGDKYIIKKSKIDNLKVSFENNNKENTKIYVKKNKNNINIIDLKKNSSITYMDNNGTFSIIKNIIINLTIIQVIVVIILFFIFCLIVYISLIYISIFLNRIKDNDFSVVKYIISMLLLFIINMIYIFPLMQLNKYISLFPMIVSLIIIIKNSSRMKLQDCYIIISMFIGVLFLLIFTQLHFHD